MRTLISPLSASFLALFVASPAWAYCDPTTTAQTSCLGGPDKTCRVLGTTTLDKDKQNIIACLATPSGSDCAASPSQCQWKSMSVSGATAKNCFYVAVASSGVNAMSEVVTGWTGALYGVSPPAASALSLVSIVPANLGSTSYMDYKLFCKAPYIPYSCGSHIPYTNLSAPAAFPGCQMADHTMEYATGDTTTGSQLTGFDGTITCCYPD